MYGLSYAGATQLQAARERPPGLSAICPGVTSAQYYNGWAYQGGAFALAFNVFWALLLAADDARRSGDATHTVALSNALSRCYEHCGHVPVRELPVLEGLGSYFQDWADHPCYDSYWRRWSVDADYSALTVPALHLGGWYDTFARGTVASFTGMKAMAGAPQKLLVGPWHHEIQASGSALGHGPASDNVVDDWQLRWFGRFLRDEDTNVLEHTARVFVLGTSRWLDCDWPVAARHTSLFLSSAGRANSKLGDGRLIREPPGDEPPDIYCYDPLSPVPSMGGTSCCAPALTPMGPADQAPVEILRDVLVYTSEPLDADVTVIGNVTVTLFITSSEDDTDFTAKLCEVDDNGRSVNIAQGVLRARYRYSFESPAALVPGQVERLEIDLGPIAVRLAAGHRVRLQVSSSDFPLWDRNLNTFVSLASADLTLARVATQQLLHDSEHPSRLTLPVIDL
jgi:putative CocE/NonD family hydrolase